MLTQDLSSLVTYLLYYYLMAKLKKFKGHCCGGGQQALEVVVEAINPPQARQFLEARYPGYTRYYTSSEIYS